MATFQRQLAQTEATYASATGEAAKIREARRLRDLLTGILNLHRESFYPAQRPIAPEPLPPDRATMYRATEAQALAHVGFLDFGGRKRARLQAAAITDNAVAAEWQRRLAERERYQQELDHWWNRLCANEPDVVLYTLDQAFEDNEAPAAAVGIDGAEVFIAVLAPDISAVPERKPAITEAGNLSLRRMTKGERVSMHTKMICGHLLVTVREAFAVAPGIQSARVAVLQDQGRDAFGEPRVACLLAARFERPMLTRVHWESADAVDVVNDAATDKIHNQRGRVKELHPVSLEGEPELAALINAVDLNQLIES